MLYIVEAVSHWVSLALSTLRGWRVIRWVIIPSCHLSPHRHCARLQGCRPPGVSHTEMKPGSSSQPQVWDGRQVESFRAKPSECQENRQRKRTSLCVDKLVCVWMTLCTQGWKRAIFSTDTPCSRVIKTKCLWKWWGFLHLPSNQLTFACGLMWRI